MGDACCGGSHPPDAFRCHRTGECCTHLTGHWEVPREPFAAVPGTGLYRLETPGGLRMFSWEAGPFRRERLVPMLVLADAKRQRLIACAYELPVDRCPRYDDRAGCTIYHERPLVCQAYPLLVVSGDRGMEVATSHVCPSLVPVVAAASAAKRPERVLFSLYPHEAAAALAVPAQMRKLAELLAFSASAGVITPVIDLDEGSVESWRRRGPVDLTDVLEGAGVMTRDALVSRQRDVVDAIRARATR